jgi:hypothetical protein
MDAAAIRTLQLLRLVGGWRPAEEAKREAEALRLAELWAGIAPGDVVELSVDATVRRGGLRIYGADGEVRREQVRVMEIEGEVARCRGLMGWRGGYVEVSEWIGRGEIDGVVREGLAVIERRRARQYWE